MFRQIMKFNSLTERQQLVLDIIIESVKALGYPPSIREIQRKSGIKSLRGVTLQLDSLVDAGYIQRKSYARGITVSPALLDSKGESFNIPFMCSCVPAGLGFDTDDYSDDTYAVTLAQTKGLKNVFAVKIVGDSMIEAGIEEGDVAIVFPQQVADDGDLVIAEKVGEGVTIKKYRVVEGRPILFPANKKYLPITSEFKIQGKVVNIIKA